MRSRLLPAAVGLTALTLVLTGCTTKTARPVAAGAVGAAQPAPAAPPAVVTEPVAPAASATSTPSPTALPSPSLPPAPTYDVAAVQTRLTALHYYGGAIDGARGPALFSAVMAFQKVQGVGADGVVGKDTLAALKAPRLPVLRATSPAHRVEVDLSRQVLYVVSGGAIARILPISSGDGRTYAQKDGSLAQSLTPVGWYTIERRYLGEQKADLGSLFDPQYFYRGWAIHGSNSVPAYPASHGCVRVTRADAKYLLRAMSIGTSVYVYGGTYTFAAGSSAPGTDNPTGDTPAAAPAASASPSSSPVHSASPTPTPTPTPSASASTTP